MVEVASRTVAEALGLLERVPMFQNLRPGQLSALAAAMTPRTATRGAPLAIGDRPAAGLIVLRKGKALRSGLELVAGEWFDELAALDTRMAEETVTAVEDVEYLVLSARAVHEAVRADPELGVALLRESSRRLVMPGEEDGPQLLRYAQDVREAFREAERRQVALRQSVLGSVRALVDLAEMKHPWSRGHAARTARTARLLAEAMGHGEEEANNAALGGLLHDVGYVVVDAGVLRKSGPLTDPERQQMQAHPEIGARIIEHIDFLSPVLPYVLHHHERVDGLGYPHGLTGKGIPAPGRLMAVVETYESLRMTRPHREAAGRAEILRELRIQAGTQLDRDVVDAFCHLAETVQLDGP